MTREPRSVAGAIACGSQHSRWPEVGRMSPIATVSSTDLIAEPRARITDLKMKAVTIVSFGGVEGLEVREVADAPPAALDRVRVRVRAAGLNRADILQRLGHYPAPPGYPQEIPGIEFAGEVEEIGDEVRRWKVSDRVFGIIGGGGQAEYVTVPEHLLAPIPPHFEWAEASAVPRNFFTAPHRLVPPDSPTS